MKKHQTEKSQPANPAKPKRGLLTYLKYLIGFIIMLAIGMAVMIVVRFRNDASIDYAVSTTGISIPTFEETEIDFTHNYVRATSIQATGGAIINLDGGVEELFLCGGQNQDDAIFKFEKGKFRNISSDVGYHKEGSEASMSATSLDVDRDGDDDLIVTRTSSIWLYTNEAGKLSGRNLEVPIAADTTPISIAVADLNRDGAFDMYVCGYIKKELIEGLNIFNQEGYGGTSALLINNGDNTFSDQTQEAGLFYKHNTFQAVFVDVDNDSDEDLVVAHDTGQVRTWKNLGDGTFENTPNPNSGVYSYPMGIAVSDYDNDGNVDFCFSNTGTTAPAFMARGDLRDDQTYHPKWILFHNEGGFRFTDAAEKAKLADYEFSWGCIFEDFNLDGRADLVVSENYVDLPPHKFEFLRLPGRFMVQNENNEFAAVGATAGVVNKRYGLSPLSADFNQDGAPDLVHVNLAGKSKVFLSQNTKNHFVKVRLPNNVGSVGAMVKAVLADGRNVFEPFVKGEGLCSDSTPVITIGTGGAEVKSIDVLYLTGQTETFSAPELASLIEAKGN